MTRSMRNGKSRTPFGEWLRENPRLDSLANSLNIIDIDWCVHNYATRPDGRLVQNFMFIEEKQWGADITDWQRDTMAMIYRFFVPPNTSKVLSRRIYSEMAKCFVTVRFFGIHCLRFENSGPIDSNWLTWNGKRVSISTLEDIVLFRRNPTSLRRRDERSHHGGAKQLRLAYRVA